MRTYLANQAIESGKPLGREFFGRTPSMTPYGSGGMILNPDSSQPGKIGKLWERCHSCPVNLSNATVIHHFTCKSLSIGTWRRVGQNAMDLVVFYAPDKASLTYYINNEGAGYKIEYPFAYIKNITLEYGEPAEDANGMPMSPQGLLVELNRPPNFFMDSAGTGGFTQCGDFTEEQQASLIMVHHLGGHPKVLSGQLAKLVSLDSFQSRHNPYDPHTIAASAPVSPMMAPPRPSSQPTAQMAHPHLAMFQENGFGMPPPGPRGHKRTRSRSVPVAVDFSMMPPMPSFHIQRPSTNMTDAPLYAPIPQHNNDLSALGPNLRIDTSSGYGLDYRQYPLSAATTNSPSDHASPTFFSSSAHVDTIPASSFNPSYSLPFLSPMGEHPSTINPSVSPLSAYSHGDPVIADGSPPLANMHRSPSTDFLSIAQDHHSAMSDDGYSLSEMYSKQNLNLPMHSPSHGMEDTDFGAHMQEESSSEEMDMHNMVSFGNMEHTSLSPEHTGI